MFMKYVTFRFWYLQVSIWVSDDIYCLDWGITSILSICPEQPVTLQPHPPIHTHTRARAFQMFPG
jgi:hypothetical protein